MVSLGGHVQPVNSLVVILVPMSSSIATLVEGQHTAALDRDGNNEEHNEHCESCTLRWFANGL